MSIPYPSVITRQEARADGMSAALIDAYLRRGRWIALHRGIYAEPPLTPAVRAAAAVRAVSNSVASHDTAARLQGIDVVAGADEHVTATSNSRRRDLKIHTGVLRATQICAVARVAVTTPARTVRDLLLDSNRLTAVWAAEHAVRLGLVNVPLICEELSGIRPGLRTARERLALVNPLSESPLETGIRLIAHDGGLPPLDVQIPIVDSGREIFRIDLGYERLRLGIEADGTQVHGAVRALYADRARANALEARGWRLLRFTWRDLSSPAYVVGSIRAALDWAA